MKPLERGQLKNWKEYLDHEIKLLGERREKASKGEDVDVDVNRIEILFERCLIACALYEEFWLKYAKWLLSEAAIVPEDDQLRREMTEKARGVFHRAITHHLQSKVDIHMHFAAFEEQQGSYEAAADILAKIEKKHPDQLGLMLRRINLERRRGNVDKVHELYRECINKATAKSVKSDLSVKYARYLRLQTGDAEGALQAVEKALAEDEANPKLYLQLLDILLHRPPPLDVAKVQELFDKALDKVPANKHRLLFSQRRVEFLEDFGTDIGQLMAAQDSHNKLTAEIREKAKEESASSNGEVGSGIKTIEGRGKKAKEESSSSNTTYPATNTASYGAHHTNQYQQYGSRYDSQYGSYGSYGGYGGYGGYGYSSGYSGSSY